MTRQEARNNVSNRASPDKTQETVFPASRHARRCQKHGFLFLFLSGEAFSAPICLHVTPQRPADGTNQQQKNQEGAVRGDIRRRDVA